MAREVAPSNQWREPFPEKVAAVVVQLYPAQDASGVWGWTERLSEADGIVGLATGTQALGVDDSTTTGGARVIDMSGSGNLAALLTS